MRIKHLLAEGTVIPVDFRKKREPSPEPDLDLEQELARFQQREERLISRMKKFARVWYLNHQDPAIERRLARMGWEIGQEEGDDGESAIFVVKIDDPYGENFFSWTASELSLAEYLQTRLLPGK
jgi:hypothetical protein